MTENKFFSVVTEEDTLVATFSPECTKIDAKNYSDIEDIAKEIAEEMTESEFVFDLKNVVYVSSAGLRMFSAINSILQETGTEYKLINLTKDILKMFQLTGYSSMFKVEGQPEF